MKKNILFVVDERRMGGVSVLLSDILNMINADDYNIDVLCLHDNGEMLSDLPKNVNLIFGTSYFDTIDYGYKEVLKMRDLNKIIHKLKVVFDMKTGNIKKRILKERKKILSKNYDVEIAFKDGFTALFTIFGNSKKKIHWLHYEYVKTNPNKNYDKLFKKILPKFDEIVAVSDGVGKAFNDIYHLENKTRVIYNLVDTNKIITKSNEKSDFTLDLKDFNVVSVGRLHSEQKGYDRLIDVVHKLNLDNLLPENFKLRIYGDGEMFNLLSENIEKYNLKDKVVLAGKVQNPYKYVKNSDLFVLPSKYEPFGLVIVEAMTLNVPVLATKNHATDKLIKHKFNGYITENSTDGLYDGLKYIFENKNELEKYKLNLKQYTYDNTNILKQINEVLSDEK